MCLFVLITCFGFAKIGHAQSVPVENKVLEDVNGNPLVTGENYYMSVNGRPELGMTYEEYLNNDYVLQALPTDKKQQVGTPIMIWRQEEVGIKDQVIFEGDWLWFEMTSSNWDGYRYFNFPESRGYVKLDKTPSILSIRDHNNGNYVVKTGGQSTVCNDKIGRPIDCFRADHSYTADSEFYLFPAGGIDENKNWLTVFPELHRKPWDLNYSEIQPFVFIPVDNK
ncbi:hypothetical protein DKP85_06055 [Bacillus thuringiensis]|nr:hypothetical protein [Bacillus toyonensis biovar Thuringiensis]